MCFPVVFIHVKKKKWVMQVHTRLPSHIFAILCTRLKLILYKYLLVHLNIGDSHWISTFIRTISCISWRKKVLNLLTFDKNCIIAECSVAVVRYIPVNTFDFTVSVKRQRVQHFFALVYKVWRTKKHRCTIECWEKELVMVFHDNMTANQKYK